VTRAPLTYPVASSKLGRALPGRIFQPIPSRRKIWSRDRGLLAVEDRFELSCAASLIPWAILACL
jgi:hypothetical protein